MIRAVFRQIMVHRWSPAADGATRKISLERLRSVVRKLLLVWFSLLFSYCLPSSGDPPILLVSIPEWPARVSKIKILVTLNDVPSSKGSFDLVNGQPGFAYDLPLGITGRVGLNIEELDATLCPIDVGQLETWIDGNSRGPIPLVLSLMPLSGKRTQLNAKSLNSKTAKDLQSIWGSDEKNVFAIGATGTVVRCSCGSTCNTIESNTTRDLHSVWGSDPNHVYAAGDSGVLIRCGAGSTFCASLLTPFTGRLNAVFGTDANNVWAAGLGGQYVHCSAGSDLCDSVKSNTDGGLMSIWGGQFGNMYIVGGSVGNGVAQQCINGGHYCVPIPLQRVAKLNSVWGVDANNVYIAGDEGTILRGHDATFSALSISTFMSLYSIGGVDTNNVYVAGVNGVVVRCSAGSNYCTTLKTDTKSTLRAIWASDADNVFIAGDNGTVLHCSANDPTCSMLASNTLQDLYAIWGSSATSVYVAGKAGTIIHFQPTNGLWENDH